MLSKNKIAKTSRGVIMFIVFFVFSFQFSHASEISSQNIIKLVNASRAEVGLEPLVENKTLTKIANDKAQDMLDKKYFSHTSPDGISPWHWFAKEGYDYSYAGENLAIDFLSAESQHEAWMKSEKHRQNILNNHYSEIGVAVAAGEVEGHMSIFTVQVFGAPVISGNGAKGGENFSAEKSNANQSLQKINGTILSAKNIKEFNSKIFSGGKRLTSDFGKAIQQNQKGVLNTSFIFVLAVALLGLAINPLIFVSKSWEEMYDDLKKIWKEKFLQQELAKDLSKVNTGQKNNSNDTDIIKLNKIRI